MTTTNKECQCDCLNFYKIECDCPCHLPTKAPESTEAIEKEIAGFTREDGLIEVGKYNHDELRESYYRTHNQALDALARTVEGMKKYPVTEPEKPKRGRPRKYKQAYFRKVYIGNDIHNSAISAVLEAIGKARKEI